MFACDGSSDAEGRVLSEKRDDGIDGTIEARTTWTYDGPSQAAARLAAKKLRTTPNTSSVDRVWNTAWRSSSPPSTPSPK